MIGVAEALANGAGAAGDASRLGSGGFCIVASMIGDTMY